MVCVSLVIHAMHKSILVSVPTSPPSRVDASRVVVIFSCFKSFVSVFYLRRSEVIFPVLWWSASIRLNVVDLLMCIFEAH
jgi:hypothetical protein